MNFIIREITPLSEKDCFYIADRIKSEFTYPIHSHAEYELTILKMLPEGDATIGDSVEIIGNYDLTLVAGDKLLSMYGNNINANPRISEKLPYSFRLTCF